MQAASASLSAPVRSAKMRNCRPVRLLTSARCGASSAAMISSLSESPVMRFIPMPPQTESATRSGCASARKAAIRAPIE